MMVTKRFVASSFSNICALYNNFRSIDRSGSAPDALISRLIIIIVGNCSNLERPVIQFLNRRRCDGTSCLPTKYGKRMLNEWSWEGHPSSHPHTHHSHAYPWLTGLELVARLNDGRLANRHGLGSRDGLTGGHFVGEHLLHAAALLLGHLVVARVKVLGLDRGREGEEVLSPCYAIVGPNIQVRTPFCSRFCRKAEWPPGARSPWAAEGYFALSFSSSTFSVSWAFSDSGAASVAAGAGMSLCSLFILEAEVRAAGRDEKTGEQVRICDNPEENKANKSLLGVTGDWNLEGQWGSEAQQNGEGQCPKQ